MTNAALARRAVRQATRELRRGKLDQATYDKVVAACKDDRVLTKWNEAIYEAKLNPWDHNGLVGASIAAFDFASILDWFVANWPKILQILMMILPLFLGTPDENTNS